MSTAEHLQNAYDLLRWLVFLTALGCGLILPTRLKAIGIFTALLAPVIITLLAVMWHKVQALDFVEACRLAGFITGYYGVNVVFVLAAHQLRRLYVRFVRTATTTDLRSSSSPLGSVPTP